MYARLSRFAGLPPDRLDETIREYEQRFLPNLEQQPGFEGVVVGIDRAAGKGAAITFWATERDMRASDKAADEARAAAAQTARAPREPIVDRYEVVIRK